MKKLFLITIVTVLITASSFAQVTTTSKTSLPTPVYPLIKSSKASGILPVIGVDEFPDVNMEYKLLIDVPIGPEEGAEAKEINYGIAEVARAINMHVAAGVPKNKIKVVVVVHGPALNSFYKDDVYNSLYHIDNPNTPIFDELLALGVKFVACGQSMLMRNISKDQLVPWLKVALSAQIPISTYQLKGYIYKKIEPK